MNVTVRLPVSLRRLADGLEHVEVQAGTVGQAVEAVCGRYEALRARMLKPGGKLKPPITVLVNNAQPAAKQETELSDGDTLVVLLPIGGG